MEDAWAAWVAARVKDYGSQRKFALAVGVDVQRVQRWLVTEHPGVPLLRRVATRTGYSLPLLIAIAQGVPLKEMARGAGADLLAHDELIDEIDDERGHIARQYAILRDKADLRRQLRQGLDGTHSTGSPT